MAVNSTDSSRVRLQAVEDLLTRKRNLILYIGFYLALISTALRGLNYYFLDKVSLAGGGSDWSEGHEYRWLVLGLILAFTSLAIARHWRPTRIANHPHLYLAVQSGLIFSTFLIPPHFDFFGIFFFLLSLQAMLFLRPAVGYLWLATFTVLTGIGFLTQVDNDFRDRLVQLGVYTAGYYFFGSFAASAAQAQRARHEAQETLEELRQRDAMLTESEERYRRLVEESPDAIVVFNDEFRLVNVNLSACRQLGYERDQLVGIELERIFPAFSSEHGAAMRRHMDVSPEDSHFHLDLDSLAKILGIRLDSVLYRYGIKTESEWARKAKLFDPLTLSVQAQSVEGKGLRD